MPNVGTRIGRGRQGVDGSAATAIKQPVPAKITAAAAPRRARRLSPFAAELLALIATAFLIAAVMTWPALRNPRTTIAHDLVDPGLMGWQVQWAGHALLHQPGRIFDGNAFYPSARSYAFSDTLLGYAPFGLLGQGPQAGVLAVNLIYVFACALASIGGYALARQLGASRTGAAVAGLAIAYAPWRLGQVGHLHVISTGGIVLALAMLARGHGFRLRPGSGPRQVRPGWIVGGWLVAAWQLTLGFGIGLVFAYVLLGLCVAAAIAWWRRGRQAMPRPLLVANLGGGAVFALVTLLMARPYLQVVAEFPYARRTADVLKIYSPSLRGFFTGPPESLWWRDDPLGLQASLRVVPEMALLPGLALYGLALAGLVWTVWSTRARWWLFGAAVVSVVLAMGTAFPGEGRFTYLVLYHLLPGFDAIRTPGRLVVWTTILLALLAAGAVTALQRRTRRQAPALLAALLVLVEGLSVMPNPVAPPPPAALTAEHADEVRAPLLVLPSDPATDAMVMLWSTDGFPRVVNGLSGFTPESQTAMREGTYAFPDAASVELLRGYGVTTVVVLRDRIAGTPWAKAADASIDGLGITRRELERAVIYSLD